MEPPSTRGDARLRHVAFFLHGFEAGGAQRCILRLAGALARRGLRVDLLVVTREGPLLPELPAAVGLVELGGRIVGMPWIRAKRRRRVRASIPALARYLRRRRPDVLVAGANHVALAAIWAHRLARTPEVGLVLRASNDISDRRQGFSNGLKRWAVRRFYGRADAIVAVAERVAADLAALDPGLAGRIAVAPNPVLDDSFAARAAAPAADPWLAPGEPPVILGAGRLVAQKDFAALVHAAAKVRARRPVRLMILGDGPEREALAALGRKLGIGDDLKLAGFLANPLPHMAAASVFVLSSAWEGMPSALIEAMACGCPVVSTDCPGGSAEILREGALGPLVPVGDAGAMAEAIERMLDAPPDREALRVRARDFTLDAATDAYLRLLTQVVRSQPAAATGA